MTAMQICIIIINNHTVIQNNFVIRLSEAHHTKEQGQWPDLSHKR